MRAPFVIVRLTHFIELYIRLYIYAFREVLLSVADAEILDASSWAVDVYCDNDDFSNFLGVSMCVCV